MGAETDAGDIEAVDIVAGEIPAEGIVGGTD